MILNRDDKSRVFWDFEEVVNSRIQPDAKALLPSNFSNILCHFWSIGCILSRCDTYVPVWIRSAVWSLEGNNALFVSFIIDMRSTQHCWDLSTGSGSIVESTTEAVSFVRPLAT